MPEAFKYVIDAAVGAALFVALLFVFAVDYFFFNAGPGKNTLEGVTPHFEGKQSKKLKLAVVKTNEEVDPFTKKVKKWDDMSKLLKALGEGYAHDELNVDMFIRMHEEKKLGDYDVIFLTCNVRDHDEKLKEPIEQYVANGGILYASDWRYSAVARAFPHVVAPALAGEGAAQTLEADIVEPTLREALRTEEDRKPPTKITLRFDMGEWKPAAFGGAGVEVLLKGTYRRMGGNQTATAPLMVRFPFNKGTVIFTSFHNEAQNSQIEERLLQYLVFSLVTAGIDAELNSSLDKGGFTPQGSNLLSTPKSGSVEKKYQNTRDCTLRFGLGFRNEGNKLRFSIKSPSGKQFTQDCDGTTILEVANAEVGEWTYTVTALNAYANFAFRTTVGEKKR